MVTQSNETWAQGSQPGDPPISSVVVAVDPDVLRRDEARDRLRVFVRQPRPAELDGGLIHDLATILIVDAPEQPAVATFEARIAANGDDGAWQDSSADNVLITDGANLVVGSSNVFANRWSLTLHYNNVTIPNGATIDVAFLRFQSATNDSLTVMRANVFGVDEDNPTAPVNVGDAKGKALTPGITWDGIPPWSAGEEGADTETPSIVAAIQTIVNRAGWASGNAMEFQVHDDASDLQNMFRRPKANSDPVGTRSLVHIEYH